MYEYLDRRYALALYEVAEKKNKVDEYINDLKEIVNAMKTNSDFAELIRHPKISTSGKKKMFSDIFKGKIDDELLSFLLVLIDKNRILGLEGKLQQMENIRLEKSNTLVADIKTVVVLKDDERKAIIDKLQDKYKKNILLKEEIDKDIIGGVYIRVGDDIIDDSLRAKLQNMKKLMTKRQN